MSKYQSIWSDFVEKFEPLEKFISELPNHPNILSGAHDIKTGVLWIREGIMQIAFKNSQEKAEEVASVSECPIEEPKPIEEEAKHEEAA